MRLAFMKPRTRFYCLMTFLWIPVSAGALAIFLFVGESSDERGMRAFPYVSIEGGVAMLLIAVHLFLGLMAFRYARRDSKKTLK